MRKANSNIWIAIDFDGTCVEHKYPAVGKNIGAERVLKRLVNEGHNLILYTMRSGKELRDAEEWFTINGVPLEAVQFHPTQSEWTTSNKAYAHLYIDDAALGIPLITEYQANRAYVDWKGVEKLLTERGLLPED